MMSIGHCTQRKPRLRGDPCLVVPFVPKPFAPSGSMVDVNATAPRFHASEERSDCTKSWDVLTFLSPWPPDERPSRKFLHQTRFSMSYLANETWTVQGNLHCKYAVVRLNITVAIPGLGYWFYTCPQFIKLKDFTIWVAASSWQPLRVPSLSC